MKTFKKIGTFLFIFSFIVLPVFAYAQGTLPNNPSQPSGPTQTGGTTSQNSGNTGITYVCNHGVGKEGECDFNDVILAVQKVLKFARDFALFFSVIVIIIAGFKYMMSGDNPGERSKANEMFRKVAIGIFFVMAAWLIVTLITNALLLPGVSTIIQGNNPQP